MTCALRQDAGFVIDVVNPDGSSIFNPGQQGAASAHNPATHAQGLQSQGESEGAPAPSGGITTVVLCKQHNPAWKAAEAARKKRELENRAAALQSGARIKVKTSGGVFEVTFLENKAERGVVSVEFNGG